MKGKAGDSQRLFHIVKWCQKLEAIQVDVQTYERFIDKKNYRLVDVSAFYIGQIGELARNLSDEMKTKLADIPWRQINAMRNVLIHNYYDASTDVIWQVITEDVPFLEKRCLEVLREQNSDVDKEIRQKMAEEMGIGEEA